jgi:protein-disulfide isomerase
MRTARSHGLAARSTWTSPRRPVPRRATAITRGLPAILACVLSLVPAVAQQPLPQVTITAAVPDASAGTLTITGENFGVVPFVTLDLVPLTIESVTRNRLVAAVPINLMPSGIYLLTVSYGPSAEENGSIQVVLGDTSGTGAQDPERNPASIGRQSSQSTGQPASASPFPSSSEPAAKVGDRVITIGEVDREWRRTDAANYLAASRDLYEKRRRALDVMITTELLAREAAARSVSVDALLKEEIPKRTITMPDSAALALYQSLGDRTRGASLDQMRPALRAWLQRITEPEVAKMNYVEELMKVSTRVDVFLEAPRLQVERAAQDAVLGPDSALVEIVAFGDFQSPAYARLAQAFGKVRDTFGDRVRFRFKNLPTLGPQSAAAGEAAECAKAQDKFWPYHDALVKQPGVADTAHLTQAAADAGLNNDAFAACMQRGEFRDMVRLAADEAARYGIKTSPSFLVNGRLVPDSPAFLPPFDYFKRVVEEELSKQARRP